MEKKKKEVVGSIPSLDRPKALKLVIVACPFGTQDYAYSITTAESFKLDLSKILSFSKTQFSTFFELYHSGQCNYTCFPGLLLPVFCTIFFPCDRLLSYVIIVEIMDSCEIGMNPLASILRQNIARVGSVF